MTPRYRDIGNRINRRLHSLTDITREKKGHAISVSNFFSGTKMGWELLSTKLRQRRNDDAFRLASSLAFYTVFSLAPILLITVGLTSIVYGFTTRP